VKSDAFLAKINGLIAKQLPEKINLESISYSDKTKVFVIDVKYNAQLSECTGLNTLAIIEFDQGLENIVTRDASGDMMVSLGAVLGIKGITCSGSGSLDVQGANLDADPFQATMSVENLAPKIIGKITPKDGKTCLSVSDVELEIKRDMVSWTDIRVKFMGLGLPVPDSFFNAAWENLPINGLISDLNSKVVDALKTQLNNMGAEQCF